MLRTTIELIQHLRLPKAARNSDVMVALSYSILKCGDKNDAQALLPEYLRDPFDYYYRFCLLKIFKKFGDQDFAKQIFDRCIHVKTKTLKDEDAPEILELLGDLKYLPVKPILVNEIFAKNSNDYFVSKYAVLGLLNFDCSDIEDRIRREIEKVYGRNLFPEFTPALVCKLKDRKEILQKLFESGNCHASTDCNAGIILGFSLCGEEGRSYFKKALFSKRWEVYSTATGTAYYAYKGMTNLGLTFREILKEIDIITNQEELEYATRMLLVLAELKLYDTDVKHESISEVFTCLFNDNDILALAKRANEREAVHRLDVLFDLKMKEEAILKNFIPN